MAKEKSNSSSVVLRGTLTQAAANGFIQASLLTGLSQSGNDALIIDEIIIEYPTLIPAATGAFEMETAISRASKAAMPNIFDDDVLYKDKYSGYFATAVGLTAERGVLTYKPESEMVIIEDTLYVDFKTLNATAAGVAYIRITARQATVTESEKVGILLTRLN